MKAILDSDQKEMYRLNFMKEPSEEESSLKDAEEIKGVDALNKLYNRLLKGEESLKKYVG